jgi:hypothetical protein
MSKTNPDPNPNLKTIPKPDPNPGLDPKNNNFCNHKIENSNILGIG